MADPRTCPACHRDLGDLPAPVRRCPGCQLRDPLSPRTRQQLRLRRLHDLDTRIVAGVAGFLLAFVWLSIRTGAWDWILLTVPAALILFALLPRPKE